MSDKSCKIPKPQSERLDEAAKNLERILKKIEPYLNAMEVGGYSTAGKWQAMDGNNVSTTLTHEVFDSILRRVSRPVNESPCIVEKNRT